MTTINTNSINNSVNNINNADDLFGAIVTYNADPCLIETDEVAQQVYNDIKTYGLELIADPTDEVLEKLDLTDCNKVKALYAIGNVGLICLDGDYTVA